MWPAAGSPQQHMSPTRTIFSIFLRRGVNARNIFMSLPFPKPLLLISKAIFPGFGESSEEHYYSPGRRQISSSSFPRS